MAAVAAWALTSHYANGRLGATAGAVSLNKHIWLHFTTAEDQIFAPPEVPPWAPASPHDGFPLCDVPFLHLSLLNTAMEA